MTTKFFAVGGLCPHGRGGVGALSTQALVNPLYGPENAVFRVKTGKLSTAYTAARVALRWRRL